MQFLSPYGAWVVSLPIDTQVIRLVVFPSPYGAWVVSLVSVMTLYECVGKFPSPYGVWVVSGTYSPPL